MQKAKIGRAIMDADVFISLSHFKGHEHDRLRRCASRTSAWAAAAAGARWSSTPAASPRWSQSRCVGCRQCAKQCAQDAISYGEDGKASIDQDKCVGCGRCIARLQL